MKTRTTVPVRTERTTWRLALGLVVLLALGGCVRSEDAVDEDGSNTPVGGTPTTGTPPAGGTPPADPPPADPVAPPADPMDPPADPMDPPADPMDPTPPDQPPPADEMPPPVDPDPPMEPMPMTDLQLFEQTVFPVVKEPANFCAGCHGSFQIPLFAVDAVADAYNALVTQQKVDLVNPANSRIYLRAAVDRHNCGGVETCDRVAADILMAINDWAGQAQPEPPPPVTAAVSGTVSFADAMELNLPRVDDNAVARFTFEEGAGNTASDDSGSGITLVLEGMEWVPEGGVRNVSGKAQASADDSRKLFDAIDATRAYSVEAWVIPDNTAQDGPARIVSYSQDTGMRNFTLGQNAIYYQLRNRSANTGNNGTPALEALDPMVTTELTHVVATFDEASGRKIYINGQLALAEEQADTLDWADNQTFVLGNEVTNNRLWQGVFKLVAVHNAALTPQAVQQNFEAGLGNLSVLRFDVGELVGQPAMIELIAAPMDSHSYLFAKPRYLGEAANVPVKNLRIAVNGVIPVASQMFRRVDTVAETSGWELSPLGAIIPQSLGQEQDTFQLHFEQLGTATGTTEPIAPAAPLPPLPDTDDQSFGVRSFSQLNDTFAALTGIDPAGNAMRNLFDELRGALPPTNDLESYGQAQQIAVQRLANGYCAQVTGNNGRCTDVFGQCSIDAGGQTAMAERIYDRFVGAELLTQPPKAAVTMELAALFDDLGCANGCNGDTAEIALAAACAATIASGAITIH